MKNPWALYGSVLAALTVVITFGGVDHHIPESVLFWMGLGTAVLAAVGARLGHTQTTPLAAPKNKDGFPLVEAAKEDVVPDNKGGLTLRDSDPPPGAVRRFGTPG
jgi:hypothetical protein